MFACHVFWMPKAGNSPGEYEDAFWPREGCIEASAPLRLAVADGATETSFSGLWARLLVAAYGRGRMTVDECEQHLRRIRRVWKLAVGQRPLPWYAEEKLRAGAFSSLLGATLLPPDSPTTAAGDWQATAIGDSCLLHVRGGDLIRSFPFSNADEFNSRPRLVSSLDGDDLNEFAANTVSGSWQPGDAFYLMTDALASWALRGVESDVPVFDRLNAPRTQSDFEAFIAELRSTHDPGGSPSLKNDDVTLVRCVAGECTRVTP